MSRHFIGLIVLTGCAIQAAFPALAARPQPSAGVSVAGRAMDVQGSTLPGVTITLTGPAGSRTAMADEAGRYRFDDVTPGRYGLRAELTGFRTITRELEIAPSSPAVVLDLTLEVGCLVEYVPVIMPFDFVLKNVDVVARLTLTSKGLRRSWLARPPCTVEGFEYTASIDGVIHSRTASAVSTTISIIADELPVSIGEHVIGFLIWSDTLHRYLLYGGDAVLPLRRGRVSTTHRSFEALDGLTVEDVTRVAGHLARLPTTLPPPSVSLTDLTVPPDRQLPGCTMAPARSNTTNPWLGDDRKTAEAIFGRLFRWSREVPRDRRAEVDTRRLPTAASVVQAYAADYLDSSTNVWSPFAPFGCGRQLIWKTSGSSRPGHTASEPSEWGPLSHRCPHTASGCTPVIAAYLRSLEP